jgi:hypothetical protein
VVGTRTTVESQEEEKKYEVSMGMDMGKLCCDIIHESLLQLPHMGFEP